MGASMPRTLLPVSRVTLAFALALPLLAPLALPAALLGCDHQGEEKQLNEMNATIEDVVRDRDDKERDMMATSLANPRVPASARVPAPALPSLESVSLEGMGEAQGPDEESADTEDATPRPTIRVVGVARVGRGAWREDQTQTSGVDDGSGAPSRPGALDPAAKPAYDAAFALVRARQYDAALDALAAFLVKWPDHPYADNAMYWRGECYFAKGDYLHAAEQLEGVVARFPAGSKAPDALLKLGVSQQKLGNPVKAKECFDRLAQTYPQSEAAHHIPAVTLSPATPGHPSEDHR
jgi:tol-pal system protein YbgF